MARPRLKSLAREYSQDGSARPAVTLGWVNAGQFVPEFEEVMDALKPGEMSQPMVSRFGVHLIRLEERRNQWPDDREQRDAVRKHGARSQGCPSLADLGARRARPRLTSSSASRLVRDGPA